MLQFGALCGIGSAPMATEGSDARLIMKAVRWIISAR
jgi:hypothetical protein